MARRKYSIRNYNSFLKATKRKGAITHRQAQAVYRGMKRALKHSVRKVDIDSYPDLWEQEVEAAVAEIDQAVIDEMLDQLQLDESYAPDAVYNEAEQEVMLSIRGKNYQRTITAEVRRDGGQVRLLRWRTVTDRTDGTSEIQGDSKK